MNIFDILTGRGLANLLGATIRYTYGTIWRTIFNKPKFTFKEYLHGPKNGDFYDEFGHQSNNRFIAFLFLILITLIIVGLQNIYPDLLNIS